MRPQLKKELEIVEQLGAAIAASPFHPFQLFEDNHIAVAVCSCQEFPQANM